MTETSTETSTETTPPVGAEATDTNTSTETGDKPAVKLAPESDGETSKGETSDGKTSDTPNEPAIEPVKLEELTLPEGVDADNPALTEMVETVNDMVSGKVSPVEFSNKLVELQTQIANEVNKASEEAWSEVVDTWADEVRNDSNLGGKNLDKTLANVRRVIDAEAGENAKELYDVLALTGVESNPHFIRFMTNVSKNYVEGAPATGSATAAGKTASQKLFPSMKNP